MLTKDVIFPKTKKRLWRFVLGEKTAFWMTEFGIKIRSY